MSRQVIGNLKKLQVTSKVDDQDRTIHTVEVKLELIGDADGGIKHIPKIREDVNKPIRLDFDPIQLKAEFKK